VVCASSFADLSGPTYPDVFLIRYRPTWQRRINLRIPPLDTAARNRARTFGIAPARRTQPPARHGHPHPYHDTGGDHLLGRAPPLRVAAPSIRLRCRLTVLLLRRGT
jgi:hypothetical protein